MDIFQIPAFDDNYIYIIRDESSNYTAVVDPGEAIPVIDFLKKKSWNLNAILITHHHSDHIGGISALKKLYGAVVTGPRYDRTRISLDEVVAEDDDVFVGSNKAKIYFTPGHTSGHIVYSFPNILFSGDNIFSLGCGKVFDGTLLDLWKSIDRLRSLPDDTLIYGAHEYTLENAKFALWIEPDNKFLLDFVRQAEQKRQNGIATIPSLLGDEKKANPFLRPESKTIQKKLGLEGAPLSEVFMAMRLKKDFFDRHGYEVAI